MIVVLFVGLVECSSPISRTECSPVCRTGSPVCRDFDKTQKKLSRNIRNNEKESLISRNFRKRLQETI